MYEQVKVTIKGIAPLLMHNPRLLDPTEPVVRQIAAITSKPPKKRTESEEIELRRLEFVGSLYTHPDTGAPVIPGENIEAMIRDGATNKRQGKTTLSGVMSDGIWPVEYSGPKSAEKLWDDRRFVDTRRTAMKSGSGVMRTRPIFVEWGCTFVVSYIPTIISLADLRDAIEFAGSFKGIMDYRPKFGRFEVVSFEAMKSKAA